MALVNIDFQRINKEKGKEKRTNDKTNIKMVEVKPNIKNYIKCEYNATQIA